MLQPFNMEMLQLFKNRTEQTVGTTYPNCIRHFLYFTSALIRSICTEKKITRIKYAIKNYLHI